MFSQLWIFDFGYLPTNEHNYESTTEDLIAAKKPFFKKLVANKTDQNS